MKFIIKSFKKNIFINSIIILGFISFFFFNDYNNIKSYIKGNKHPQYQKVYTVTFQLTPEIEPIYLTTVLMFENEIKKKFTDDYYKLSKEIIKKPNRFNINFKYIITFEEDRYIDIIEEKIDAFNKSFLKLHSNKINDFFQLKKEFIFIDDYLSVKELSVNDIYSFLMVSINFREELKLGQKKKVYLSKLVIGNFLICIFLSILTCLITQIIRDDISQLKK